MNHWPDIQIPKLNYNNSLCILNEITKADIIVMSNVPTDLRPTGMYRPTLVSSIYLFIYLFIIFKHHNI